MVNYESEDEFPEEIHEKDSFSEESFPEPIIVKSGMPQINSSDVLTCERPELDQDVKERSASKSSVDLTVWYFIDRVVNKPQFHCSPETAQALQERLLGRIGHDFEGEHFYFSKNLKKFSRRIFKSIKKHFSVRDLLYMLVLNCSLAEDHIWSIFKKKNLQRNHPPSQSSANCGSRPET